MRLISLLFLAACTSGSSTDDPDADASDDGPASSEDHSASFTGTSSAVYFSQQVGTFADVEETVTASFDGDEVHIPFALCDVVGTGVFVPSAERVVVDVDVDDTVCGFEVDGVEVDVSFDGVVVSWDREELSLYVIGEGTADGVEPFSVTISFDGVAVQ